MAEEARACMANAAPYRKVEVAPDEKDGMADCWLETAEGGPMLDAFICSPQLVESCELSFLTCVDDQPGEGGDLWLYTGRIAEPLSAIRATPERGGVRIRLAPGEALVSIGKEVAHRLTPIGPGRTRITSAVCFERA